MSPIIELHNVTKQFTLLHERTGRLPGSIARLLRSHTERRLTTINDLSLSVMKGESVGIIGKNGAGKSTLLKLIAGVLYSDRGSLRVDGTISPFLELDVGFQDELSGIDNIYLYGALLGLSRADIVQKIDAIVHFSGLEQFIDQRVKNYSTGMQMRLAFAITSHVNADIFLIDEALAVGDTTFQEKCLRYMQSLRENGKTILFVSHDLDMVIRHCDRVIVLHEGCIVKDAPSRDAVSYYKSSLENVR